MNIFKRLFRKNEAPDPAISISVAGEFQWAPEDECWASAINGVKLSVAYDGLSKPSREFIDFIESVLGDASFVDRIVCRAKSEAKSRFPEKLHNEIDSLKAKDVVFQSTNFILVQFFDESDNEPFWFCEVHGDKIYVGRDT